MRSSSTLLPALTVVLAAMTLCLASTTASDRTTEPAQFFTQHNSRRVKIRYGPFTTDSMDINNGMATFQRATVEMPCTDCLITWMQAGLEYSNGTVANADTNFWLHHTVLANLNRTSTICPSPGTPDEFFASGNERTPINICVNGTVQAGYFLGPNDTLGMLTELMNMDTTAQTGYVTITYEYIPNPPSSFSTVNVLWLDIGGCYGSSDQPVKSTTQAFQYTSPDWVSDISGRVTFIAGHLHDGGTHLEVRRNATDECDCVATYGANSAYIGGGMAMSMSMDATSMAIPASSSMSMSMASMSMSMSTSMPATSTSSMAMPSGSTGLMDNIHISNISVCANPNNVVVSPGDIWSIIAHYDPTQHDLMMDANGTAEPIMGIALVYVADLNVTTTPTSAAVTGTPSASTSGAVGSSGVGKNMEMLGTLMSLGMASMMLMSMLL